MSRWQKRARKGDESRKKSKKQKKKRKRKQKDSRRMNQTQMRLSVSINSLEFWLCKARIKGPADEAVRKREGRKEGEEEEKRGCKKRGLKKYEEAEGEDGGIRKRLKKENVLLRGR